jgi:hypothetical protein
MSDSSESGEFDETIYRVDDQYEAIYRMDDEFEAALYRDDDDYGVANEDRRTPRQQLNSWYQVKGRLHQVQCKIQPCAMGDRCESNDGLLYVCRGGCLLHHRCLERAYCDPKYGAVSKKSDYACPGCRSRM